MNDQIKQNPALQISYQPESIASNEHYMRTRRMISSEYMLGAWTKCLWHIWMFSLSTKELYKRYNNEWKIYSRTNTHVCTHQQLAPFLIYLQIVLDAYSKRHNRIQVETVKETIDNPKPSIHTKYYWSTRVVNQHESYS